MREGEDCAQAQVVVVKAYLFAVPVRRRDELVASVAKVFGPASSVVIYGGDESCPPFVVPLDPVQARGLWSVTGKKQRVAAADILAFALCLGHAFDVEGRRFGGAGDITPPCSSRGSVH